MSSPVSGTPLSSAERPTAVFISSARTCWYLLTQALMQGLRCDNPAIVALHLYAASPRHPMLIDHWDFTESTCNFLVVGESAGLAHFPKNCAEQGCTTPGAMQAHRSKICGSIW